MVLNNVDLRHDQNYYYYTNYYGYYRPHEKTERTSQSTAIGTNSNGFNEPDEY